MRDVKDRVLSLHMLHPESEWSRKTSTTKMDQGWGKRRNKLIVGSDDMFSALCEKSLLNKTNTLL